MDREFRGTADHEGYGDVVGLNQVVIARSESDEAIHVLPCGSIDCFAEPVIGRRFAPTRWLAMTGHEISMGVT
jgi:hypothetical protein